jgi:hypothetical protein
MKVTLFRNKTITLTPEEGDRTERICEALEAFWNVMADDEEKIEFSKHILWKTMRTLRPTDKYFI